MPGLNALVDKIRAKYPGAYDDLDDAALTKSVLAKYPQYSDLAAPGMPSAIPPKGQLPGEPSGQSFTERSAGRVEQNLTMPGKLLDMFPNAISSALQSRSGMTDKGKATLYPFGDSTPAKIAGIATVAQRQTYGMAKDLVKQWMADPATAVGDVATVALPLAESGIPANKQFSPSVPRGTSFPPELQDMVTSALKRKAIQEIPGIGKLIRLGKTGQELLDIYRKYQESQQPPPMPKPGEIPPGLSSRGGFPVPVRSPIQPGFGEAAGDQSIIDSMRADLERHARAAQAEYRAGNTVDVPKGALVESAMEQLRRRAEVPQDQPMPNMIPEGQRASDIITQEQAEAIGNRIMARGETKAGIESGKVGTTQGALSDTALFQQAKAELPNGTVSDWAKRAQELKMRQVPTGTVKYTTTPPSPAKQNLNDPNVLMDLLKKSVAKAKTKKGQPRPKQ